MTEIFERKKNALKTFACHSLETTDIDYEED